MHTSTAGNERRHSTYQVRAFAAGWLCVWRKAWVVSRQEWEVDIYDGGELRDVRFSLLCV